MESLKILYPTGQHQNTLIALHCNAGLPEESEEHYAELVAQDWCVAIACSGQEGKNGGYVWNDLDRSLSSIKRWGQISQKPYWAGYSASAHMLLMAAYTGEVAAAGVLCLAPSLLKNPSIWPENASQPALAVPSAFILGQQDDSARLDYTRQCMAKFASDGVPIHEQTHDQGHCYPSDWPAQRTEALAWLLAQNS